ncbi:Tll0287-like domain-containing protein [Thiohalomonas denitrificans]|uniref:Tll0287-like domain-containing protein n=1 Tax=Thiohalomonas denitrificans TaxID=415747 RepID=UPI0026F22065|nr:DUF3365 domain-containing protein [Thiohalomonas denitrificans]
MKKLVLPTAAGVGLLFFSCLSIAEEIGVPNQGGHPEYLFLEKVPQEQGRATAEMISQALAVGRLVIFSHMKKLTDPELGDKGFTGDYFVEQWLAALEPQLMDITPAQQRILDKLIWAGKLSIDNNQDRLNVKGTGWKHFLPAKWAREAGLMFNSRTGIVTRQPARNYRHPSNAPDSMDKAVLTRFIQPDHDGKPYGEETMMGKQPVYRYFEPVELMEPCLACHGKPKGELDVLGYEKDGLEGGDVIGMISVTVPIEGPSGK